MIVDSLASDIFLLPRMQNAMALTLQIINVEQRARQAHWSLTAYAANRAATAALPVSLGRRGEVNRQPLMQTAKSKF